MARGKAIRSSSKLEVNVLLLKIRERIKAIAGDGSEIEQIEQEFSKIPEYANLCQKRMFTSFPSFPRSHLTASSSQEAKMVDCIGGRAKSKNSDVCEVDKAFDKPEKSPISN